MKLTALLPVLCLLHLGCLGTETSAIEVYYCDSLSGDYQVQSISCDGTEKTINKTITYSINGDTAISSLAGSSCTLKIEWATTLTTDTFSLEAKNTTTCTENGVDASSCSDSQQSCTSGLSLTLVNTFNSCKTSSSGTQVTLKRTVTSDDLSASECSLGEEEVISLSK